MLFQEFPETKPPKVQAPPVRGEPDRAARVARNTNAVKDFSMEPMMWDAWAVLEGEEGGAVYDHQGCGCAGVSVVSPGKRVRAVIDHRGCVQVLVSLLASGRRHGFRAWMYVWWFDEELMMSTSAYEGTSFKGDLMDHSSLFWTPASGK